MTSFDSVLPCMWQVDLCYYHVCDKWIYAITIGFGLDWKSYLNWEDWQDNKQWIREVTSIAVQVLTYITLHWYHNIIYGMYARAMPCRSQVTPILACFDCAHAVIEHNWTLYRVLREYTTTRIGQHWSLFSVTLRSAVTMSIASLPWIHSPFCHTLFLDLLHETSSHLSSWHCQTRWECCSQVLGECSKCRVQEDGGSIFHR